MQSVPTLETPLLCLLLAGPGLLCPQPGGCLVGDGRPHHPAAELTGKFEFSFPTLGYRWEVTGLPLQEQVQFLSPTLLSSAPL